MDGSSWNRRIVATRKICIRKVDIQNGAAAIGVGTEKERPLVVDAQIRNGQKPRAFVKNSLLAQTVGTDISVMVKQGEGVAALEYNRAIIRVRGFSEYVELIVYFDYIVHFGTDSTSSTPSLDPVS